MNAFVSRISVFRYTSSRWSALARLCLGHFACPLHLCFVVREVKCGAVTQWRSQLCCLSQSSPAHRFLLSICSLSTDEEILAAHVLGHLAHFLALPRTSYAIQKHSISSGYSPQANVNGIVHLHPVAHCYFTSTCLFRLLCGLLMFF
jgi:hypothetical protein